MNQRYIRKLHKDFEKCSKQIGISEEDMPELVTDKHRLREAITERTGDSPLSNRVYYKCKSKARGCLQGYGIVYVNTHQRYFPNTQKEKVLTYRHFFLGLIHELVHYRFEDELEHGKEFNDRIKEILQGKTFPLNKKRRI